MQRRSKVSPALVKALREKTSAGVLDCRQALLNTDGDVQEALELLRQRGLAIAEKKASRTVGQGIIEAYVHHGGQIGAMIELNCETDFVAHTSEFKELAHNLALQIAAMSPEFISSEEESSTEGEREKNPQKTCLLLQPFIKDDTKSVKEVIAETIAKVGENIKVRRFARFELGNQQRTSAPVWAAEKWFIRHSPI
jgi:elongation factor Ts